MSSWLETHGRLGALVLMAALGAGAAQASSGGSSAAGLGAAFAGIGRTATPAEIRAWDIDVRPDFKGLPKGAGSVRQGEVLWEAQCASCHGSFGESSDIFTPIAGGTTAADIKSGRVASLLPGANQPQRSTLMKVSTLSTLWDYINRAMPWNSPKSLSADEVYAVTAYILHLGNIVPADFTLSDGNIRDTQQRLPNRNGMTTAHALWPGSGTGAAGPGSSQRPDVQGDGCQRDCGKAVQVKSSLPDYARSAHGQLADQSRVLGATRGADTSRPPAAVSGSNQAAVLALATSAAPEKIVKSAPAAAVGSAAVMPLLQKNACVACHGMNNKMVGPSFAEIARKYKGRADAETYLAGKIKEGGQGVWGNIPMPAQSLSQTEAAQLAQWLVRMAP